MGNGEFDFKRFGNRIKKLRMEKGFRQYELAELLGISGNHMSKIENGKEGASLDLLYRICIVLDVSSDYLIFGNRENSGNLEEQLSTLVVKDQYQRTFLTDLIENLEKYELHPKGKDS